MLSNFHILTVSHQETALERLPLFGISYSDDQELKQILHEKKKKHGLQELYYLSTCNRVLYLFVTEQEIGKSFIADFFSGATDEVRQFSGDDAILYLFQVASSIHSMVVGEREIITQIRTAYEQQVKWSLPGDNIRLVIQQTVRAAKRVYAETRIGEKPVSVVSLAVSKMLDFELPKSATIIMVGAGQTNKLMVSHLLKKGYSNINVYNRSLSKAQDLVGRTRGTAGTLEDLELIDDGFDCLIACTGALKPTVSLALAKKMTREKITEKIWVDLGLPGDLDPEIQACSPARMINLPGLKKLSKVNMGFRKNEIDSANHILNELLESFKQIIYRRRIERAFKQIPNEIKTIKDKALLEVFKSDLEMMDNHTKDVVSRMMDYMEKRCISIPMKAAKEASL